MSEFLQFWWRNCINGWSLGSGIFSFIEAIALIGAFVLGCLHHRNQKRWEEISMKVAVGILILAFVISTLCVAPFLQYKTLSDRSKADLRVSVLKYYHNRSTHELVSRVQFVNNGSTRRTVLGITFTYRTKDSAGKRGHHILVGSMEELYESNNSPVYVEPGKPETRTYRHELYDESLMDTPGAGFGLDITTVDQDTGGTNETYIEVMTVIEGLNNESLGIIGGRKTNLSLDVTGGSFLMENQKIPRSRADMFGTSPSPTATVAP